MSFKYSLIIYMQILTTTDANLKPSQKNPSFGVRYVLNLPHLRLTPTPAPL